MNTKKSLFVCVGDVSADRHAGKLVRKIKEKYPDIDIWGVGGSHMEASGVRLLYNRESLAVIGLVEVIKYLPKLISMRSELLKRVTQDKPDALLLMDFGGFNLGFASMVRKRLKNVPIIYFISPQVWGSRPWRINAIAKAVSKMLVIFPFEEALYRSKGLNATFVGHPLIHSRKDFSLLLNRQEFCAKYGLVDDPNRPIIGIFPGSRSQEIRAHSKAILQAINWLNKERPELQFVLSLANTNMSDKFYDEIYRSPYKSLLNNCLKTISSEHNEDLMCHSELLWAKSGTTTLEATLNAKPMILFYAGSWISYLMVLILKIVKYIGWPNLLAGYEIVPELIQLDCRAEKFVKYTCDLLDCPGLRQKTASNLKELSKHLGEGDFTDNACSEIVKIVFSEISSTKIS